MADRSTGGIRSWTVGDFIDATRPPTAGTSRHPVGRRNRTPECGVKRSGRRWPRWRHRSLRSGPNWRRPAIPGWGPTRAPSFLAAATAGTAALLVRENLRTRLDDPRSATAQRCAARAASVAADLGAPPHDLPDRTTP